MMALRGLLSTQPAPSAELHRSTERTGMKPGVKRDLIFVVLLVAGILLWGSLGFMLAPSVPPAAKGSEPERLQPIESLKAFMNQWMLKGMFGGVALVLLYSGFRTISGRKWQASGVEESPEDSYLSGKAVAVIVSIFAAVVIGAFAYVLLSGDYTSRG